VQIMNVVLALNLTEKCSGTKYKMTKISKHIRDVDSW
jgi:hypothetical protein